MKKRRSRLETCIVDDHCDVVPFIFAYWRKHKIRCPVPMIHFDSHPDMAVPSCKTPFAIREWRNKDILLEQILVEEGCIAEWILPLFALNILSQVVWIRPEWSNQLP